MLKLKEIKHYYILPYILQQLKNVKRLPIVLPGLSKEESINNQCEGITGSKNTLQLQLQSGSQEFILHVNI